MRVTAARAVLGLLALTAAAAGCKDKAEGSKATEAVASAGDLEAKESEILQRRDSLLKSRKDLRDKQAQLEAQRAEVAATGGDTSEIDKQKTEVEQQLSGLDQEESQINTAVSDLMAEQRAVTQALAAGGGVTAREAAVAEREKALRDREAKVAARETEVNTRERDALKFQMEKCLNAAPAPTTIIQTIDAKGSQYTKKDVEPLLSKARSDMAKKGLLHSDLPPAAQGLEKDATEAMKKGDYAKARYDAAQLVATVRTTDVNKALVAAKAGRLSALVKAKKLPPDRQQEAEKLYSDATSNLLDGKFAESNRKLNRIYSMLSD
jgi:DNA repair exonuclease SbcCD ATPase subunit